VCCRPENSSTVTYTLILEKKRQDTTRHDTTPHRTTPGAAGQGQSTSFTYTDLHSGKGKKMAEWMDHNKAEKMNLHNTHKFQPQTNLHTQPIVQNQQISHFDRSGNSNKFGHSTNYDRKFQKQ